MTAGDRENWFRSIRCSTSYDCGFEDRFKGGDLDYDDNVFRINGALPSPGTLPLLGMGAAVVCRRRRRDGSALTRFGGSWSGDGALG